MIKASLSQWDGHQFRGYYGKYYKTLVMYAIKFVGDMQIAEDIVQDVFSSIWEDKTVFDNEPSLRSFLYTCVRNHSLDNMKHRGVEQAYISKVQNANPAYFYDGDNESLGEDEVFRRLFELIDTLPARQREIFLHLMEGKKVSEIANIMNISIDTVKTQKRRAKETLRRQMSPEMLTLFLVLFA